MITRNTLRAIALATTCLAPMLAHAQSDDFTVEDTKKPAAAAQAADDGITIGNTTIRGLVGIGVMGVVGTNPNQAGRYSGFNTTGVNGGIPLLEIAGRPVWDSGSTRYYELTGNDLFVQGGNHLDSRIGSGRGWASTTSNTLFNGGSLGFKIGDQGTWGAGIDFRSITYTGNVIDSLYSVNGSQAYLNPGLLPWGGATATSAGPVTSYNVATLGATGAMLPVQTGVRRNILGANFKYQWQGWTFTGALRHETKTGSMENAFYGAWGGTAFAMPINYTTDRYDVSASYNTRTFQSLFQYTFSHFTDGNLFVNLPYPISNNVVPYQRSAAYSLPPSNDAHYVTLMLADSGLIPRTRLNLNARVGFEVQNAVFAPNTADPNPIGAPGYSSLNPLTLQGTTANSPAMMAEVYQLRVSAASRPFADIDAKVWYGLDGRHVSLNQYEVNVGNGGGRNDASLAGLNYVVPQNWFKQNAGAEVGYVLLPESETKVTVGYRYDSVHRTNAQVTNSSTNTASVGLSSRVGRDIDGELSFSLSDRSGSMNYLTPWLNLEGEEAGPNYSGAYYQAPMTSQAVTLRADYTPSASWSGGLFLQFRNENYHYSLATPESGATASTMPLTGVGQGVKQDYALVVGPDLNFRPAKDVSFHLYYTYELLFFDFTGNGPCSTAASAATAACAGTVGYFRNKDTAATHTFGVSGDWQVNDKLKLRADYSLSIGSVMFSQFNGVFVGKPTANYQNVTNYPDINSLMHSLRLTATYAVTPGIDLVMQGAYLGFHNNDWNDTANAIQGNGTGAISILTPGYAAPNYSVVSVLAGANFRF